MHSKVGGGRRKLTAVYPTLKDNLLAILQNHTAGDPMKEGVRWTNLSRRAISRELEKTDTPAGKNVVSSILREQEYRRRKPQKSKTMGQHKDRNAQFENIAKLKQEYLAAGKPVLSVDTKKKELLGNFYREGITDSVEPVVVNDHDFVSQSNGKVIPHGIYDVGKNEAMVNLNTSSDTSEFACESLKLWWNMQGKHSYLHVDEILILCDGGGSNSARSYLFKEDMQKLSNETGLKFRIAHYPSYCSKYNPIEHRAFPHITSACKGVALETVETARHYMEKAETTTGLTVVVNIIDKCFKAGRKYAIDFKEKMTVRFDNFLPKWNYTFVPETG